MLIEKFLLLIVKGKKIDSDYSLKNLKSISYLKKHSTQKILGNKHHQMFRTPLYLDANGSHDLTLLSTNVLGNVDVEAIHRRLSPMAATGSHCRLIETFPHEITT